MRGSWEARLFKTAWQSATMRVVWRRRSRTARDAAQYSAAAALSEAAVAQWMQHTLDAKTGKVVRWYLPGSHSLNFLLENSLGGGGVASLRIDPQGKAFAQQLLEFPVPVPRAIAEQL